LELWQILNERGADYIKNDKAFAIRLAKRKLSRHYSMLERLRKFIGESTIHDLDDEIDLLEFHADDFLTEDFVVNQDLIENAKKFIGKKPEITQKVFYLFYELDLSIPEIAEMLSISESSVKNKLYRTLKELRELLS
jgi:RNA polymerase sigma-70 factor (ECF subfamily)